MANLLDLKNKITSTKNTGQITNALELVSASKQKKAVDFLQTSRFLRNGVNDLICNIAKQADALLASSDAGDLPPLFRSKSTGKVLMITVMSNRGLCGPINSSLFFEIVKFKKSLGKQVDFLTVNKLAQKYLKSFKESIIGYFSDIPENPDMDYVKPLIHLVKEKFPEYETVYIAYSEFIKSGIIKPKIMQVLPLNTTNQEESKGETSQIQFSIEPDPITILETLSNLYIDLEIYEAILSNQTSEHSARMVAMQKATENVKNVVDSLTLTYNKERQSKITQAMAEISANI